MKKKILCLALTVVLSAGLVAPGLTTRASAVNEVRTVWLDDERFLTLTFDDLISEEIILIARDDGVKEATCFYIPYTGATVKFSGWVEGEGCWKIWYQWKDGAYEEGEWDWYDWDIFPDYSPGIIFDFNRDYGYDYDYYESLDIVECYHGIYFKYSHDFRPAWYGKVSSWAIGEVSDAIMADLVTDELLDKDVYTGSITRLETAQLIVKLIENVSGLPIDEFIKAKGVAVDDKAFTDTGDKAVLACNALDIINGVGDGRFNPTGILKRAQAAAIVNRVAKVMGVNTSGYTHSFIDVENHWSNNELGWPAHAEILLGDQYKQFNPEGNLTIEATIAISYRSYKALTK
ncbi:MAG: S-layer homology domain-containing protein [Oscillospiraceae bacterium]|nr:S-layer homology domain-containing protein [Oscillospiraceae bacterium]